MPPPPFAPIARTKCQRTPSQPPLPPKTPLMPPAPAAAPHPLRSLARSICSALHIPPSSPYAPRLRPPARPAFGTPSAPLPPTPCSSCLKFPSHALPLVPPHARATRFPPVHLSGPCGCRGGHAYRAMHPARLVALLACPPPHPIAPRAPSLHDVAGFRLLLLTARATYE